MSRFRERPDDAEVDRDVLAVVRRIRRDEDVARVHVGVEEAVAEHLREEDLDAGARQALQVDARGLQLVDAPDRDAGHALHHQHLGLGGVPVDAGDHQERRVAEVAAQQRAVRGLAREVELVAEVLLELGDDRARLQALAVRPQPLDQHRRGVHQREVLLDHAGDRRAQHLDRDRRRRAAVLRRQLGEVHLRDRRARDRLALERCEDLARPACRRPARASRRPGRTGRAARGPAASRARRRCRAATGRAASTASGRT